MKPIMQVAEECNLSYNLIRDVIKKEKIITEKINGRIYLNKYQEDYIHQVLFFESKITEITYQSKINDDIHS